MIPAPKKRKSHANLALKKLTATLGADNPKFNDTLIKDSLLTFAEHSALYGDHSFFLKIFEVLPIGSWRNRAIDFYDYFKTIPREEIITRRVEIRTYLETLARMPNYKNLSQDFYGFKSPESLNELNRKVIGAVIHYKKHGDWTALLNLLPTLKTHKNKVIQNLDKLAKCKIVEDRKMVDYVAGKTEPVLIVHGRENIKIENIEELNFFL